MMHAVCGRNCYAVQIAGVTVSFSYDLPLAFSCRAQGIALRNPDSVNHSVTTTKHANRRGVAAYPVATSSEAYQAALAETIVKQLVARGY